MSFGRHIAPAAMGLQALFATHASAEFVNVTYITQVGTIILTPPFGTVYTHKFYAQFTSPQDRLVAVRCSSADGEAPFYQHSFGTWKEPSAAIVSIIPDLALDTYLSIGLTSLQTGQTPTAISPGSTFGAEDFQAGWSTTVDAPYTHGPSVFIGQLTYSASLPPFVTDLRFVFEWIDGDGRRHESCWGMVFPALTFVPCYFPQRADFNHDCRVDGVDLAMLLANWGAPCGIGSCIGELTCQAPVNGEDLAELLAEWGPVPGCALGR